MRTLTCEGFELTLFVCLVCPPLSAHLFSMDYKRVSYILLHCQLQSQYSHAFAVRDNRSTYKELCAYLTKVDHFCTIRHFFFLYPMKFLHACASSNYSSIFESAAIFSILLFTMMTISSLGKPHFICRVTLSNILWMHKW